MEPQQPLKLDLTTRDDLHAEMQRIALTITSEEANAALMEQAHIAFERLQDKRTVEGFKRLGEEAITAMSQHLAMLKSPMETLVQCIHDDAAFADELRILDAHLRGVDPKRVDAKHSAIRSLLAALPGIGTPLTRWSTKCRGAEGEIKESIRRINDTRTKMERDATTLRDDQRRMRELGFKLKDYLSLARLIEARRSEASSAARNEKQPVAAEELQKILAQKTSQLTQCLKLNQQCLLDCEVLIRNNRELIIGVDDALNVTVAAVNKAADLHKLLQPEQGKDEPRLLTAKTEQALEELTANFATAQATLGQLGDFRSAALSQATPALADIDLVQSKSDTQQLALSRTEIDSANTAFDIQIRDD